MKFEATLVHNGTVTTPQGFQAGAFAAGIKPDSILDLGILYSETPCTAAGVFTTNKIKAPPVILSKRNLENGIAQAIVVNSGCANAFTGLQGHNDAFEMSTLAAARLGLISRDVVVASTGVIGRQLPMEGIRNGIHRMAFTADGGHDLARAIMTTDLTAKEIAVDLGVAKIGGIAKGAGMIHPDMATMLCFLTTDAAIDANSLHRSLKSAVDASFNMISVDGDTSTNDKVVILANGLAGRVKARDFDDALLAVCTYLARSVASDGEGSTRLIEVTVEGAITLSDARAAARTIVSSPLVKAAIHGGDPNWGRIVAALGRSGAELVEQKIDLYLDDHCVVLEGTPQPVDQKLIIFNDEVQIRVCLNLGKAEATAWGCDLSEEYVTINSKYTS